MKGREEAMGSTLVTELNVANQLALNSIVKNIIPSHKFDPFFNFMAIEPLL